MTYDVLILGGGPAGLSAALGLGRARRRVLLCDGGPRRNAAADHMHNFVTRDGMPPPEFRRIGREQLTPYKSVEVRDVRASEIRGARGAFDVRLEDGANVTARRVLLCTGMIDELPNIDGLAPLWGKSVFICPYCHAWEVQNRRFAFLAPPEGPHIVEFAIGLRAWTSDVTLLTNGNPELAAEARARLAAANVRIDARRIARVVGQGEALTSVAFTEGEPLGLDVLFVRSPQRQVPVVASLGVELDPNGYVRLDEMGQTSIPGVYAAGDLTTMMQSAILAAAAGTRAATVVNVDVTTELANAGLLP